MVNSILYYLKPHFVVVKKINQLQQTVVKRILAHMQNLPSTYLPIHMLHYRDRYCGFLIESTPAYYCSLWQSRHLAISVTIIRQGRSWTPSVIFQGPSTKKHYHPCRIPSSPSFYPGSSLFYPGSMILVSSKFAFDPV